MRKLSSATRDLARRLMPEATSAILHLPRRAAEALQSRAGPASGSDRRLWFAVAVACPAALAASIVMPRITIVMSPSIEAWVVTERPGPIARGDYVRFVLNHPIAGPKPVQVTKHALCLPGDRLSIEERPSPLMRGEHDGWYYCNGRFLGVSLPRAHNGMLLQRARWSGIIPPGMAYVGSSHPCGFDSRYIGLVPIAHLTRMERLL